MGTPDFSVAPLKKIVEDKKHEVIAVCTNLDKPTGRKQILTACPVKVYAESVGIPVYQYKRIRAEGVEDLKRLSPDIIVTCAFGQILSAEIIDIPKFGVINVHASLLPKYRGASPIHYAILNGETKTGITIMRTDVGIDTGDMIEKRETDILPEETCGELFDRLSILGSEMIGEALDKIERGEVRYIKQDDSQATYSKIIKKEDALIDFNKDAKSIVNQVRAFNPSPVAYAFLDGQPLKIYKASVGRSAGEPETSGNFGKVISTDGGKIEVACKGGTVLVETLQKSGGKMMSAKDFLNGNKDILGKSLVKE